MEFTFIKDAKQYIGETKNFRVWLANKRGSNKLGFLVLRDGTGFTQGVVKAADLGQEIFDQIMTIDQESALQITAEIKEDGRSEVGFELIISSLEVIGTSKDFPITPKEHGADFLMSNRHLWIRSKKQTALLKIRSEVRYAVNEFFRREGFYQFDAPLLTSSAAEGGSELFQTDFFGRDAYLSQTGQLYAEAGIYALNKVYTFGPIFRAEKSKTRKHLNEFWMIEPEVAFNDQAANEALQERFVKFVVRWALDNCAAELKDLGRDIDQLEGYIAEDFAAISYTDAITLLNENGFDDITWGEDFGAPHENFIADYHKKPVFVQNFPKAIKAFYMKEDPNNPEVVKCADLLVPDGYGEIIGGSERIYDLAELEAAIAHFGVDRSELEWYIDLRKFGSVPHSGFGLGFERLVSFIADAEHIREVIPFARLQNRLEP